MKPGIIHILICLLSVTLSIDAVGQTLTQDQKTHQPDPLIKPEPSRHHCPMSLPESDRDAYVLSVRNERLMAGIPRDGVYNIPVQFHLLRQTNGAGGISFAEAAQELEWANDEYDVMGIEFFQCSPPHEIFDDGYFFTEFDFEWEDYCGQTTAEYEIAGDNNIDNVINIYYVNTDGWNWSSFPHWRIDYCKDWIIMDIDDIGNQTLLAHELGHYFNLLHTHQGYGDGVSDNEEAIVRNTDDDCYNCPDYGDLLCDTYADNNRWDNCNWDGTGSDGCSDLDFQPDEDNIMSYSGCQSLFSSGQESRIVYNAITSRAYLDCPFLSDCIENRIISGTQSGTYAYQASQTISSTADINDSANSVYDAGSRITLTPGFHAKHGTTFNAILDGCWNPVIFPED